MEKFLHKTESDDLILLENVSEKIVLLNLKRRYKAQNVYTYIGPVLIAINPYKVITKDNKSIYDESLVKLFSGKQFYEMTPHPFSIAEHAYSDLMRYERNQCILITGQSGAGKTETSKVILQYVSSISTLQGSKAACIVKHRMSKGELQVATETIAKVKRVLTGSNTILEAFGNAQTIRNYNSSRFGKYMVLQCTRFSGQVVGGYIRSYLLERSRLVYQANGERNFHAFYHLLSGCSDEDRVLLKLDRDVEFKYLTYGMSTNEHHDDKAQYDMVRKQMKCVGWSEEEIKQTYEMVAIILWLGNVGVVDVEGDKASIVQDEVFELVANLIGISKKVLQVILLFRTIRVGSDRNEQKSVHSVPLSKDQAIHARNSLAKALYEKLFLYLIHRVNSMIASDKSENCHTVGILDIYGFEIVQNNLFEQLCINYVNEKLQQLFIAQTLKVEQEEYEWEGVMPDGWDKVAYFNNELVCDLIESKVPPGIFCIVDEQGIMNVTEPNVLLNQLQSQCGSHKQFLRLKTNELYFKIEHYAGTVEYSVDNFLLANVDTMYGDLYEGLQTSTNTLVNSIFIGAQAIDKKRPPSTSSLFRQQVNALIDELNESHASYIRCIKPNEDKQPMVIDDAALADQVQYLGILENLKVRRMGFCYRSTLQDFYHRFKMLSPLTWPNPKNFESVQEAIRELLEVDSEIKFEENGLHEGCFAIGKTKIFIRYPKALFLLERLRTERLPSIVAIIEKSFLSYKQRIKIAQFQKVHAQAVAAFADVYENCQHRKQRQSDSKLLKTTVYKTWDDLSAKVLPNNTRLHHTLLMEEQLISVIFAQSYIRARQARKRYHKLQHAALVFSSHWRGVQVRRAMPVEKWNQCHEAMLGLRSEFERFMGQKRRRRESFDAVYKTNYMDSKYNQELNAILTEYSQTTIYFAGEIVKVNQRFKSQHRVLLITESFLFNLKCSGKGIKQRRCIEIKNITKLSLSTLPDNYLMVHVGSEYDYYFKMEQKTQVVKILRDRYFSMCKTELSVHFSNKLDYFAYPEIQNSVQFIQNTKSSYTKEEKLSKHSLLITYGTNK